MRLRCANPACNHPITEWGLTEVYRGKKFCRQTCLEAYLRQDRRLTETSLPFRADDNKYRRNGKAVRA